tara:strand:- start:284 stop:850 length:567 start_codon:yes stop_codon:yes gene_type:complete
MAKRIIITLLIILINNVKASEMGSETGLTIPRFVSLKSNDANIRVGPSINYPITIKYIVKNFPLMIIEEHSNWRKIIDFEQNIGWIHKSLIKGERYGIIISEENNIIKVYNTLNGKIIGKITKGNIVSIEKCKIQWCLVSVNKNKGWVNKRNIWGVKDKEIYKIGRSQIFIDYFIKYSNLVSNYLSSN